MSAATDEISVTGRPGPSACDEARPGATKTPADRVAVLGIRHHGPGSARSVVAELDRRRPAIVLIEGPSDADPLLALAAAPGMTPPVALLAYVAGQPRISAFWPFAVFSPEWQALLWAAREGVPVRFCDLPSSMVLASVVAEEEADADQPGPGSLGPTKDPGAAAEPEAAHRPETQPEAAGPEAAEKPSAVGGPAEKPEGTDGPPAQPEAAGGPGTEPEATEPEAVSPEAEEPAAGAGPAGSLREDPIAQLAGAAGYDDPERWWDDVIESRLDGQPPFAALTEAMAELRRQPPAVPPAVQRREDRREAHMRQVLRAALKETDGTVAVVCGAWHAPALSGKLPAAAADATLLRGAERRKTTLTWVPWTHSRLAAASGYGAGVTSPGWYHHLFTAPDHVIVRWLTRVAGVLRARDLPVSSAHVIEAVRLAETLATLRGRPLAGLAEVSEATLAVLCEGNELAAEFVTRDLVIGELLGAVPDDAPMVPLEADLRAQARTLRLRIDPLDRALALDLRTDGGRDRSILLHRLTALGIDWGTMTEDTVRATGTFRETWSLRWQPELAVSIVDAATWGTTVAAAAASKLTHAARTAADLAAVTAAVETCLLASLPGALPAVLRALDEKAALDLDAGRLMTALPALVRAVRYGDVRGTDTTALARVADALVIRICAGLPAAVSSLSDEAAAELRGRLDATHAAVALRARDAAGEQSRDRWLGTLRRLAGRRDVHGLLAGRIVRVLVDSRLMGADEAARRFAAHLSVGSTAADKAAWAEGFLSGSGLLLVHDRALLGVLDDWVAALNEQDFLNVLPLLRRTFGGFSPAERANLGGAVRQLAADAPEARPAAAVDERRAAGVLATVAAILGGGR